MFVLSAGLGIVIGSIIIARAKRKALGNAMLFGINVLLIGIFTLMLAIRDFVSVPIVVSVIAEFFFYGGWIVLAFYVEQTFIKGTGRRDPYRVILTILACLAVASMTCTVIAGLATDPGTYEAFNFWRFVIDNLLFIQIVIVWCVGEGFAVYRRLDNHDKRFVGMKYLLFSTGYLAISSATIMNFLGTYYVPALSGLFSVLYGAGTIVYVVFMCLVWVTPDLLARVLRVTYESEREPAIKSIAPGARATDIEAPGALYSAVLKSPALMSIINHLGSILSNRISKPVGACNGFLLMTLSSTLGEEAIYSLTLARLERTFKEHLPGRLRLVGIADADAITTVLVDEFTTNKAFMTMAIL